MRPVQGSQLLLRVRQDTNTEGSSNPSDAEIVDRLNRAKAEYVDLLRSSGGAGYFRKRTPLTATQAGVSLYATPSDFVSLSFVLAYLTPTQFIVCSPFTDDMRPMFATLTGTGWVMGQPVYYQLDDDGFIEFMPVPTGAFAYVLGYQYAPPDFLYDADRGVVTGTIEDVNGWTDFIVARANAGLCRKLKLWDDAAQHSQEAERLADHIRAMAPMRDIGAAPVQRDVTRTMPAGYWEEFDQ